LSSSTSSPSPFSAGRDGVRIRLRVAPGASANRVAGLAAEADGGVALRIMVTAVAEDGKANAAATRLLSRFWGVAKSQISVVAGAADRRKTLLLAGDPDVLLPRLEASIAGLKQG
jgi:uncharacterized protein YggU (UPF0235/DUF167 family)